ncbi:hypothetical protein RBE51_19995 [Pseudomonas taiwanensis]|uniref:hypothetical protein n=1 Tax=Pseudomonas taiwanensis TaxID=470150 RepID=UPI0028DE46F1|nr:hypothetical protein [Pseudomonas taiwanensis]MDT8925075.1 hypothetical protein [Pseudomonas taiwanensis]
MRNTIEVVDPGGLAVSQGDACSAGSLGSRKRSNQPPQMIADIGPDIVALVAKVERPTGNVQQVDVMVKCVDEGQKKYPQWRGRQAISFLVIV